MNEVAPGIYWLQLPVTIPGVSVLPVNAYLVQGDRGYLLVDTGWDTDEAFDSLKNQLAEIGAGINEISQIVMTHIHPDHFGLAGRLKRLTGAELALRDCEEELIESRYINMDSLLQQTSHWLGINGVPADELPCIRDSTLGLEHFVASAHPDVTLHGGEVITTGTFNFQVLLTPGHSPGHICLYEAERKVLVSGDHILPAITSNVGKHPQANMF